MTAEAPSSPPPVQEIDHDASYDDQYFNSAKAKQRQMLTSNSGRSLISGGDSFKELTAHRISNTSGVPTFDEIQPVGPPPAPSAMAAARLRAAESMKRSGGAPIMAPSPMMMMLPVGAPGGPPVPFAMPFPAMPMQPMPFMPMPMYPIMPMMVPPQEEADVAPDDAIAAFMRRSKSQVDREVRACHKLTLGGLGEPAIDALALVPGASEGELITGSENGVFHIYNVVEGTATEWVALEGDIIAIAFNPTDPDMFAIAVSECPDVLLFRISKKKKIGMLKGHRQGLQCLAFHPVNDGTVLVSAGEDADARVWDFDQGKCTWVLQGHESEIVCCACSYTEKHLAGTGSVDGCVKFWNIEDGSLVASIMEHDGAVTGLAFCPQADLVASCSFDKTVRLLSTRDFSCFRVLKSAGPLSCVVFNPLDMGVVAVGGQDGSVQVWDAETAEPTHVLVKVHNGPVTGIAYGLKNLLCTASMDGQLKLWKCVAQTALANLTEAVANVKVDEGPSGRK